MKYLIKLHEYRCIKRKMSSFKIHLWENTMFVNSGPKSDGTGLQFNISLMLSIKPPSKPRKINMCRKPQDTIDMFLERIKLKLSSDYVLKTQNIGKTEIELQKDGIRVCDDATLSDIFENNNSTTCLLIRDMYINVVYNAPILNNIKLNKPSYEKLMLYPYGFDNGFNVSSTHINYLWYRITPKKQEIEVGCQMAYTPTAEDIDCCLKLVCKPYNEKGSPGPTAEILSSKVLKNTIDIYPHENRLKERDYNQSIRVISYNILAGGYTKTKEAELDMYPYCSKEVLASGYRNPLVLKELIAYKADIICLQEVESSFFNSELQPLLKLYMNMNGVFLRKNNHRREGLSCFYSIDKFTLLNQFDIKLNDLTTVESYCGSIVNDIIDDEFWKIGLKKTTVFQVLVLELKCDTKHLLLICNTHLISDPEGDSTRLMQSLIELTIINQIKKKLDIDYPERNKSIIFCGDFNSTPESGVYDLATNLLLPEKHRNDNLLNNLKNVLDFKLESAYGIDVEYSNYTQSFFGLLDYIYFTNQHLEVIQTLPMPPHDVVTKHVGLPSLLFPSDHLALIADLKLK
ncbi:2',5'-phosphodiesterase 12 isoform X2 [Sipha flava]|nr:2',5'-phosphodiesterase 12 isoform X2 [Sipha flava]